MHASAHQPVSLTMPPEQVRASFLKIACRENPDPLWHYELAVDKATRRAPPMTAVPQSGGNTVSLALFNRPEPPCDLEIYGTHLAAEVDPADWLDLWLEAQPFKVLSRLRFPMIAGAVGDVVISWEANGSAWMGRLFAMKAGPRLALLWFRTAAVNYQLLAESMFFTISTFRFLDDSPGALAEQIRWAQAPQPVPWRTAVPVSWEIKTEPASARVASFQASLLAPNAGNILGKLSFAIIALSTAPSAADVFRQMQSALRDANTAGELAPRQLPAAPPCTEAWHAVASGTVSGTAAEIHARVLRHPQAWVAGLVVTPPRAAAPALWMRNKRVLDIAMDALQFGVLQQNT